MMKKDHGIIACIIVNDYTPGLIMPNTTMAKSIVKEMDMLVDRQVQKCT